MVAQQLNQADSTGRGYAPAGHARWQTGQGGPGDGGPAFSAPTADATAADEGMVLPEDFFVPDVSTHGVTAEPGSEAWRRMQGRQLIREFLRAVPRDEDDAHLAFVRPDGTPRLVRRADLSRAIDHMRPRMRQVMRLAVEERWPRARVCEYLRGISIKTLERDQVEALDLLMQL